MMEDKAMILQFPERQPEGGEDIAKGEPKPPSEIIPDSECVPEQDLADRYG